MTVVTPYKRPPVAPVVAWLDATGRVTSEHGEILDLDDWPADTRAWTDFDTARQLLLEGKGEALCWLGEEIRWRHRRLDKDGWTNRRSDVAVLRLPFPEDVEACLRALALWRTWLSGYGAAPTGTSGSAAWSLLRATLREPLYTGAGWRGRPERLLRGTLGARIELGPHGAGEYRTGFVERDPSDPHNGGGAALEHWDLPAAYASELGALPYGGQWHRLADLDALGMSGDPEFWARGNRPVFVNAKVKIPAGLPFGPLPLRPRRQLIGLEAMLLGVRYPVGVTMQGLWTWQELQQALAVGCRIVKLVEGWAHIAGGAQPFAPWWDAIQTGRTMPGLAGTLAKVTGNALWGRFCMDGRAGGQRTIRSLGPRAKMSSRPWPLRGGLPPSHDLAETISGRVRAKLHAAMAVAGPRLISAHTDGFWTHALSGLDDEWLGADDWRLKDRARRLQVLNPQALRYWPTPPAEWEPGIVLAGVPSRQAGDAFEQRWQEHLEQRQETPGLGATTAEWNAFWNGQATA